MVNRAVLWAGAALATTDKMTTNANQSKIPTGVIFNGKSDSRSVFQITAASIELIGNDKPTISQDTSVHSFYWYAHGV